MNTDNITNSYINTIISKNDIDLKTVFDKESWIKDIIDDITVDNITVDDGNSSINITTSDSSSGQSINYPNITYNPLDNYINGEATIGTFVDPRVTELEDKIKRLEKYFDKIKKVMPWVPDEDDEFK